jgi:hypothetical protein
MYMSFVHDVYWLADCAQMDRLCRTQIYLPAQLTAELDRLARCRGTSRAELIRQAAREFLAREGPSVDDPILGVIGLGNAGPGNAAEEHDRFLVSLNPEPAA